MPTQKFHFLDLLLQSLHVVFFLFDVLCLPLSAWRLILIGLRLRCRISRTIKKYWLARDYDKWAQGFFSLNLLQLQLRNLATSCCRQDVCFSLCFDKTSVRDVFPCFSESPLNTNTRIIQTLWHVSLVSVLTGFHCIVIRGQEWKISILENPMVSL